MKKTVKTTINCYRFEQSKQYKKVTEMSCREGSIHIVTS